MIHNTITELGEIITEITAPALSCVHANKLNASLIEIYNSFLSINNQYSKISEAILTLSIHKRVLREYNRTI